MACFLIKDVRIFDGEKTIERGFVLVEDGKISKLSAAEIEFSGETISKPGHTLLPGLIDVHIHANSGNEKALPQALRFGVTTVCDLHNEWPNILKLRRQREEGDCADLKTTSFAATIDGGWPEAVVLKFDDNPQTRAEIATWPKLVTPEDGRNYVRERVDEGVDYIKLMHESGKMMSMNLKKPSLELQRAIIDEAHKSGLIVVAHATCIEDTLEILGCGVDGMAHSFLDSPPTQQLIDAYKKNGAHCNPTLAALGSGTTEGREHQEQLAHDPRVQHLLGVAERERMCMCMGFVPKDGPTIANCYETVRQLKKAGVPILLGSDSAGPAVGTAWGLSAHHELFLFVQHCDFTPTEALMAATSIPARRFKFADRGFIREGLRADLFLVEGNPLEDIDHTLDLRAVWIEGQLCSAFKSQI